MRTGLHDNRKPRFVRVLGVLVLCIVYLSGVIGVVAQPEPRPNTLPVFYDPDGVYDEGQTSTLTRDAQLLQSSKIPTVVYVRITPVSEASPESAHEFAQDIRLSWQVETATGADDGLVLLYSHVPDNPQASTVVASWGDATFAHSGLTPEYVESVLSGDVRTLLDQGHPFEALVYGIRELRYAGIYFPPSPESLEGIRQVLHTGLTWVAPALVVIVSTIYAAISWSLRPSRTLPNDLIWKIVVATGLVVVLLGVGSVIGQSRIGIACALLIVAASAIQTWLWAHPGKDRMTIQHIRSVPPTRRRLRMRTQFRRMNAIGEVKR